MFEQLDAALKSVLGAALQADVDIRFGAPHPSMASAAPVVNVFLHQVVEDQQARTGAWVERRDGNGRLVARDLPPRQFRCCYLLTTWAEATDTEHAMLGACLAALAAHETLPSRHLPLPLANAGYRVAVAVGAPSLPRMAPETWSALAVPPRSGLDIVLTSALLPATATELAPAPSRITLGVARDVPQPASAGAAGGSPATEIHEAGR